MPQTQSLYNVMVGPVTLQQWEVPEELPNLFGVQKTAVHDFAGGQRTVQVLGNFPFDHIEWRGKLFNGDAGQGATAQSRSSILNQLRMQLTPVNFVWGEFNMTVIVVEFEVTAKMFQFYEYRIKLLPVLDNTTTSNSQSGGPLAETTLQNAQTGMSQATTAPTTGATLPPLVQTLSGGIQNNINTAMQNASQVIAQIPTATIVSLQSQLGALSGLLQGTIASSDIGNLSGIAKVAAAAITDPANGFGLVQSTNFPLAVAAQNLSAAATVTSIALNGNNASSIQQISVVNPNLIVLASQYYGNPADWQLIASANNLQDYQLQGSYTLVIPPITANTQFTAG